MRIGLGIGLGRGRFAPSGGVPAFATTEWQLITENWETITTNWN